MKKVSILILVVLLGAGMVACKGGSAGGDSSGGAAAAKAMMNTLQTAVDEATDGLKNAKDGKTAAAALSKVATVMKKMMVEGQAMAKKYPKFDPKNSPVMKKAQAKLMGSIKKFQVTVQEAAKKFMTDKDFLSALKKMGPGMMGGRK